MNKLSQLEAQDASPNKIQCGNEKRQNFVRAAALSCGRENPLDVRA
jgi:hypothetical protein